MAITKMKMKRRIPKIRKMSEILKHATVITDFTQLTNTIDNNAVDSIENGDCILPKSLEKCNKSKSKQKRSIPKRRSLSEIMNTTTPVSNFSSLNNTGNDDVCSLPPINAIGDDVIFPIGNIDHVNPIPSIPSLHKPRRKRKFNPRAQNTASAISSPPTNSLNISPTIGSPTLVNATSREATIFCSLVKVECVHFQPNLRTYTSGFVIKGRKILTTAHSVANYTHVMLSKKNSNIKYVGTVLVIGAECDIALLTVEDNEFWEGVSPVEFGDLPALEDSVTVVGYPIRGDTISVTSGVVSKIEILSYFHGSTELLGLQIDAAINSGKSGGPAFNHKGKCVGIAFQSLKYKDIENIGYVIPTSVIMHLILDYEKNGTYTGFPSLGVEWQKMENPDLRLSMGMKAYQTGIRIRRIDPTSPELKVLKSSDIILSFDGVDIANDGTVPLRRGERIGFRYLVSLKYTGDSAKIKVLRNSQILSFSVKLGTHRRLIPAHKCQPPSYYIVAGFVFTTASIPYRRSEYGKDYEHEASVKLLDKLAHGMPESRNEQIIVVSQVLEADINIGYEDIVNAQVLAFNGRAVKNLKNLASMVERCDDEYLKFDLEYQQIVVLKTKAAKAATLDILSTHFIPSAMSDDLKT